MSDDKIVYQRRPSGFVDYTSALADRSRPVVAVIDPENDEEFNRLYRAFLVHWENGEGSKVSLRDALREYANPKPPACSARVSIAGKHFGCVEPEGHALAHHNDRARAVWGGDAR